MGMLMYQLEAVGPEQEKKILNDLEIDLPKKQRMLARGGYIASKTGIFWAVNHEMDSYLFMAPKLNFKEARYHYYFFFRKKFHELSLKAPFGPSVQCDPSLSAMSDDEQEDFKKHVVDAFAAHGILGLPNEKPFAPSFGVEM